MYHLRVHTGRRVCDLADAEGLSRARISALCRKGQHIAASFRPSNVANDLRPGVTIHETVNDGRTSIVLEGNTACHADDVQAMKAMLNRALDRAFRDGALTMAETLRWGEDLLHGSWFAERTLADAMTVWNQRVIARRGDHPLP